MDRRNLERSVKVGLLPGDLLEIYVGDPWLSVYLTPEQVKPCPKGTRLGHIWLVLTRPEIVLDDRNYYGLQRNTLSFTCLSDQQILYVRARISERGLAPWIQIHYRQGRELEH